MSSHLYAEALARFPTMTATGRDDKAWAKRILHRHEKGDTTLLPVQVRFAQEAMNRGTEPA